MFRRRLSLAVAVLCFLAVAASAGFAQDAANGAQGVSASAAADDMSLGPEFEVATIRSANRDDGRHWFGTRIDGSGRLTASAVTLSSLVWFAYVNGQGSAKVAGGSKWAQSDAFDVNAKVDDAYMAGWDKLSVRERTDRMRPMLRRLLADRFQLKLRIEMQPTPVYALVQARGGAKMKEAPAPQAVDDDPKAVMRWMNEHPDQGRPGSIFCTGNTCTGTAIQMRNAVGQIQGSAQADRMVIDQTGLKGYYNFTMTQPRPNDDQAMEEVEDSLGLKFEPRTMPIKTYVIESAEKPSVDGAEVSDTSVQPSTAAKPAFSVASIRPSPPDARSLSGPHGTAEDFSATMATVESMIGYAYNVPWVLGMSADPLHFYLPHVSELMGGPDWIRSDKYDLKAKLDGPELEAWNKLPKEQQKEQLRMMLRALLADRFKLTIRQEKRELPVYALTVAKDGLKLQVSKGPPPNLNDGSDPAKPFDDTKPYVTRWGGGDRGWIKGRDGKIDDLVSQLWMQRELGGRKVLDRTGLTGRYDIDLKWASVDDPRNPDGPSLFTAIQEELGLKLDPVKAPVDVLVIDHIERPSAN
jgi:uncharacterized protein (TIGR03435 family)